MMSIIRSQILPFFIFLVFLVALVAVSARIFLPADMMAPAPIEEQVQPADRLSRVASPNLAELPPSLSRFINGLPDDTLFFNQDS